LLDGASTGRFFEMKFFWVPQGKFCEERTEITRRGQKNKSQKIFFLRKRRMVAAPDGNRDSFFCLLFFAMKKK
jgi:hypothetical protein